MAVMDDLISESSNVVGVSSTGECVYTDTLSLVKITVKCKSLEPVLVYFASKEQDFLVIYESIVDQ